MPLKENDLMSEKYWTERYQNCNTPWDMGTASPPLTAYCQRLTHKDTKILIPGAGNAWEAEWLHHNGFTNVWVIDISMEPLLNLKKRLSGFPDHHLIHGDFFDLKEKFELVIEQTFFCALQPDQRPDYVKKMSDILIKGGKLAGVFFDFPLSEQGPPFGGDSEEYEDLFSEYFKIHKMERCYNSIKPRSSNELFLELIRS